MLQPFFRLFAVHEAVAHDLVGLGLARRIAQLLRQRQRLIPPGHGFFGIGLRILDAEIDQQRQALPALGGGEFPFQAACVGLSHDGERAGNQDGHCQKTIFLHCFSWKKGMGLKPQSIAGDFFCQCAAAAAVKHTAGVIPHTRRNISPPAGKSFACLGNTDMADYFYHGALGMPDAFAWAVGTRR
jgi:hypothetical protein